MLSLEDMPGRSVPPVEALDGEACSWRMAADRFSTGASMSETCACHLVLIAFLTWNQINPFLFSVHYVAAPF
jgi:hypothetical protein